MSRISLHSKVLLTNWNWIWMSKLLQLIGKCKIWQSYQGPVIHMGLIATNAFPLSSCANSTAAKLYPHLTSSFTIAFCSMSFWGACHNTWEEERKVLHLWIFNSLQWRQVTMPRRQRSTPHPEAG
jgi:hypothetical protein